MRMADALARCEVLSIVAAGGAAARVRRLALAALIAAGLLAVLAQPVTAHRSTAAPHHTSLHGIQAQCSAVPLPC
jgi:hypothetical protein